MSNLHKGDQVVSQWGFIQTVEAVSQDGEKVWLMNENGQLGTFDARKWEKVEPFFEKEKHYKGNSSAHTFQVNHVDTDRKGRKYAVLEDAHDSSVRLAREIDFRYYTETETEIEF